MSQEDAISSFSSHDQGSPPSNPWPHSRNERVNGNSALSTIRFDVPQLATQTSSTIHDNRDYESHREKEGKLASI